MSGETVVFVTTRSLDETSPLPPVIVKAHIASASFSFPSLYSIKEKTLSSYVAVYLHTSIASIFSSMRTKKKVLSMNTR